MTSPLTRYSAQKRGFLFITLEKKAKLDDDLSIEGRLATIAHLTPSTNVQKEPDFDSTPRTRSAGKGRNEEDADNGIVLPRNLAAEEEKDNSDKDNSDDDLELSY